MAPELFSGARPSIAFDLYALGVIFHFMLTGKIPGRTRSPDVSAEASTLTMQAGFRNLQGARRCEALPSPSSAIVTPLPGAVA